MLNFIKNILLIISLLEIICFVLAVKWLGFGVTLLLLIASSLLGISLIRKAKESAVLLTQQLQVGAWQDIAHTRYILAGLLLLIPGFLTDIVGLLCLVPLVQKRILTWLGAKPHYSANDAHYQSQQYTGDKPSRVIEGEFWREEDKS